MAESIFTIQVSFDSTISIESVLLIKIHGESQIVCFKMHQRGSVKRGNMGKSFFKSMRVIWVILSHLKMTQIILNNLKRENCGTHISLGS